MRRIKLTVAQVASLRTWVEAGIAHDEERIGYPAPAHVAVRESLGIVERQRQIINKLIDKGYGHLMEAMR